MKRSSSIKNNLFCLCHFGSTVPDPESMLQAAARWLRRNAGRLMDATTGSGKPTPATIVHHG